jgi:hypothetical protein
MKPMATGQRRKRTVKASMQRWHRRTTPDFCLSAPPRPGQLARDNTAMNLSRFTSEDQLPENIESSRGTTHRDSEALHPWRTHQHPPVYFKSQLTLKHLLDPKDSPECLLSQHLHSIYRHQRQPYNCNMLAKISKTSRLQQLSWILLRSEGTARQCSRQPKLLDLASGPM